MTKTTVRTNNAGDLLASIPTLVGFAPANSVVLIALHENRLGVTMRADLPPTQNSVSFAQQLAHGLEVAGVDEAIDEAVAVIVDDTPHRDLVDHLVEQLAVRGIMLEHAYHVSEFAAGARWQHICNAAWHGVLPDPKATVAAATLAVASGVTRGSREQIEESFRSDDEEAIGRRAALLDGLVGRPQPSLEWQAGIVRAALHRSLTGQLTLSDEDVAALAYALTDPGVRDACLATALPSTSPLAHAAMNLWRALTRMTPAPERAEPAVLAGFAAYMQGDGATATIALEVALDANPDHVLAGLLRHALDTGVPPDRLHPLASGPFCDPGAVAADGEQ
ncbi:DUF4192 domain-containing protein [Prauserella oleivorans]|uniref:DUF4192 domain-containing protein n=1 Tax=Prauserella oleivorans TaxID=1478153 RepID=A0ABW5WGQ6_9PSEU